MGTVNRLNEIFFGLPVSKVTEPKLKPKLAAKMAA